MNRWPLALIVGLVSMEISAQSPLGVELARAWKADPAVVAADLASQEAEWVFEQTRRSWWPVASFDSPALVAASEDGSSTTLGVTVAANLAQKLPGGGSLIAGISQSSTKLLRAPMGGTELTIQPAFTVSLSQPLTAFEDGAEEDRALARLVHVKSLRDLYRSTVRRAATLDTSRLLLEARNRAFEAALAQSDLVATWEAQGRATKTESWKARREADAARWAQEKATLDLEAAEQEWSRTAGSMADSWSLDEVLAFEAEWTQPPSASPSLEDDLASLERVRAERAAQREGTVWAPLLSASATSRKPEGQPWQLSGQIGVKWSTDALVLAPVARQKAELVLERLRQTALIEASVRQLDREARERQISRLARRLALLAEETSRQAQVVAETRTLVESHQLPAADLAVAEADQAQLAADYRSLLWEKISLLVSRN